jgi:hypothetical protein
VEVMSNKILDEYGFIFVPKLIINPENLQCDVPEERGLIKYRNNRMDKFVHIEEEFQVNGSLSRYNIPIYRELHYLVKNQLEQILDMDLYPSYYFDRFYFAGQKLDRHTDRPACEISVTLQVSSNRSEPWPIWFELPDGSEQYVSMNDGDAVIYKGCEREHWRDPLPSQYNKTQKLIRKIRRLPDDTYHHQLFLHYVDANGPFLHHAYDVLDPV